MPMYGEASVGQRQIARSDQSRTPRHIELNCTASFPLSPHFLETLTKGAIL